MLDNEFDPEGFEKALSLIKSMDNRNRLFILCLLCDGERTVTEMAEATELSLSAMSQHLSVLRQADLVETEKYQQSVTYRLKGNEVKQMIALLKKLYCDSAAK
ncbi:helix-turn-helix transcriptional regulator [Hahella sp. HN01]|uniref:ArsR/SmtB family transcription factor n=1 Tax=Hahella sp. HN01 TaxID=2847262 RepID=UPI001C1EC75F|nr:metalloregulator ArsR/SmtB family transcription factor [Hahella sp. HN01]MBU6950093.1 metalloregulator ArsR/SmtB family transcription factor [Hahella sp. HN01]